MQTPTIHEDRSEATGRLFGYVVQADGKYLGRFDLVDPLSWFEHRSFASVFPTAAVAEAAVQEVAR